MGYMVRREDNHMDGAPRVDKKTWVSHTEMTYPRKTHHDLESTGGTFQVIGIAEKIALGCISMKIITVLLIH